MGARPLPLPPKGRRGTITLPLTASIFSAPLTQREEDAQLRLDFAAFAQRCFRELNPLTVLAMN